jgi:glyoxalase family protein
MGASVALTIPGIHHVTCITGDIQKCVDFYVGVLGLRFVKKSINQDLPDTYHIYFGDYVGTPGTAMTFFGWPTWPKQRVGSGQVVVVSFQVPSESLGYWSDRLQRLGVDYEHATRFGIDSLLLRDADGIELELAARASDQRWHPWPGSPVDEKHAIRGFDSVALKVADAGPTTDLLTTTMGFRLVDTDGPGSRFETGEGGPHATLDVIQSPNEPAGDESIGTVHHVAWRTPDAESQKAWRDILTTVGRSVTPVIDRWYFKSIYFREPGGVLFEIATDGPGFTVDEIAEKLGSGLSLPPWFQVRRDHLDEILPPIVVPTTATTGVQRSVVN